MKEKHTKISLYNKVFFKNKKMVSATTKLAAWMKQENGAPLIEWSIGRLIVAKNAEVNEM